MRSVRTNTILVCIECQRQEGWTHKWLCSKVDQVVSQENGDILVAIHKGKEAP